MRSVRALAPAKINWTLEVLGKRPDGYHEVRTILQTIDVNDILAFEPGDALTLEMDTDGASFDVPLEENLAYRAARLLRERTAHRGGAHIRLTKRIPVAAGLGGGSSAAAAVLLGLRRLWQLDISDDELARVGAELGSDVPFFLRGGCALASGRGEVLTALPDRLGQWVYLVFPKRASTADKTARMYAALRAEHYTDGGRTERLAERLRAGEPVRGQDVYNVFAAVLPEVDPEAAELLERVAGLGVGRPHLCGSGPAFFFLAERDPQTLSAFREALSALPCDAIPNWTVSAAEATSMDELG